MSRMEECAFIPNLRMSSKHLSLVAIGLFAALLIGFVAYTQLQNAPSANQPTVGESATATYTLTQIAEHKTPTDCWTIVNNGVYDLTSWISKHPGGDQSILSMCGIDASAAYTGQHGGQGKPERVLASFLIGSVQK